MSAATINPSTVDLTAQVVAASPKFGHDVGESAGKRGFAPLKVVKLQVLAAMLLSLMWVCFKSGVAGLSALVGGAICFVPALLFALRLRRARRQNQHEQYLVAFLFGEAIKVFLSIVLFAVVAMKWSAVDWLALLTTYIVVLQAYVFGLLLVRD